MTHTVAIVANFVNGVYREIIADVAVSSYTAGGEVLSAEELGLAQIDAVVVGGVSSSGYMGSFIQSTKKLVGWMGDNNNASDGPAVDATASANIGTFRIMVLGKG